MIDKLELNTKAQELREMLGEDANSPVDIFALAGQIDKLTLCYYPLGDNISGMCVVDEKIRLIAVNSTMSYGRQRFSLAHELYHLFYDTSSRFNVCAKRFDTGSDVEKNADQFASYFLAPYKALKALVGKTCEQGALSLANIIEIEQYFGMSHAAMLWRLFSEGYITKEERDSYSRGVTLFARQLGFDDKLYMPTWVDFQKKTYGYYLKQVEGIKKEDLVSEGKIDELLLDAYRDDIAFGYDETGGEIID